MGWITSVSKNNKLKQSADVWLLKAYYPTIDNSINFKMYLICLEFNVLWRIINLLPNLKHFTGPSFWNLKSLSATVVDAFRAFFSSLSRSIRIPEKDYHKIGQIKRETKEEEERGRKRKKERERKKEGRKAPGLLCLYRWKGWNSIPAWFQDSFSKFYASLQIQLVRTGFFTHLLV